MSKTFYYVYCTNRDISDDGGIVFTSENISECVAYLENLAAEIYNKKNGHYDFCAKIPKSETDDTTVKLRCWKDKWFIASYSIIEDYGDIEDVEVLSLPVVSFPVKKQVEKTISKPAKPLQKKEIAKQVPNKKTFKIANLQGVANDYFNSKTPEQRVSFIAIFFKYIHDLAIAKYNKIENFCNSENGEIIEGSFVICPKLNLCYVISGLGTGLFFDGFSLDEHQIIFKHDLNEFVQLNFHTIENILKVVYGSN